MNKRGKLLVLGVVVLIALMGAVVWFSLSTNGDPTSDATTGATAAATELAAAWVKGELESVPVSDGSVDLEARVLEITSGLGAQVGAAPVKAEVTDVELVPLAEGETGDAKKAEATVEVTWQIDPSRTWTYDTIVTLVEVEPEDGGDPTWKVVWAPSLVHPRIASGDKLEITRLAATRGEILKPDGQPLVGLRPVVEVGIQPGATTDRRAAAESVAGLVGVDAAALADRVEAAGADDFVSAVTLRREAYDQVSGSLKSIPGVVFHESEIPLAPTREFARALLGSAGPATQEIAAASGGRIALGDITGLSGLQASQDEVLAGKAGISIRVAPPTGAGRAPFALKDYPAEPGQSITITLDEGAQIAADEVMANAPKPAALVAIRVSTGDVLAVSNGPSGADGYNRAMVGKYPPGSTFKVASALALLENGLTPETVVDCPATIVVGKEFSNAEGEVLGSVPFSKDFADSCNTAFVGQSRTITAQQLADTAAKLGYRKVDIGAPLLAPSVPVDGGETEHAANMIGQGKVEATPFAVALASASVASGRSVNPRLIIDPKAPEPVLGDPLPAEAVEALQGLMRGVVTDGTGGALLGVPGGDVHGKTGTAEYGNEDPPKTHAWFTGYQGDVAFAVLVEDGGFGGQVAAPLAAQFLEKLAAG